MKRGAIICIGSLRTKTLKKIDDLLKDIERNGESQGIGKPEFLKNNLKGLWRRRIDDKNRLVYRVVDGVLEIMTCREHYGD